MSNVKWEVVTAGFNVYAVGETRNEAILHACARGGWLEPDGMCSGSRDHRITLIAHWIFGDHDNFQGYTVRRVKEVLSKEAAALQMLQKCQKFLASIGRYDNENTALRMEIEEVFHL